MRVVEFCRREGSNTGINEDLVYFLTVDDESPIENYGVAVLLDGCGEKAVLNRITFSRERIERLASMLSENLVTPVTLRDVVEDIMP